MQQYKPTFGRHLLIHFLRCLIAFALAYFIALLFELTFAEYLRKLAFFTAVYTLVALLEFGHYTIYIKDGEVIGPGQQWKRAYFPVTKIDWAKSVPVIGWKRWFKNEYVVSTDGDKILVHLTFTKQQRESLWQELKEQARTALGN